MLLDSQLIHAALAISLPLYAKLLLSIPIFTHTHTHTIYIYNIRGEYKTLQRGNVSVSVWMDRKLVKVMSNATDPTEYTTVLRRQRDGTRIPIPCPMSVSKYNEKMGAVDTGDQLRGYYRLRTKFRKFYMYVYSFLYDVAVTNSFILYKNFSPSPTIKTIKDFHLQLATELIGNYCSRRLPGRQSQVVRPLPLLHYPLKAEDGRRGRCKYCYSVQKVRRDTRWFCNECNHWLCHQGKTTDCFITWHKRQCHSNEP